jgi:hypothetical protein
VLNSVGARASLSLLLTLSLMIFERIPFYFKAALYLLEEHGTREDA